MSNAGDDNPLNWPDERLLTRDEAAAYARALGLRMKSATLAKYAWRGDGPLMTYFGAKPHYRLGDLRAWLMARMRRSRSTTRKQRRSQVAGRKNDHDETHEGRDDVSGGRRDES